jgi:hypothetical protein
MMTGVRKTPLLTTLISCILIVLPGCATTTTQLYAWGDYPDATYRYITGTDSPEEQIQVFEKMRERAHSTNSKLPPGFFAHMAMLYEQTGQRDKAREAVLLETQLFPEFRHFGALLIKSPVAGKDK